MSDLDFSKLKFKLKEWTVSEIEENAESIGHLVRGHDASGNILFFAAALFPLEKFEAVLRLVPRNYALQTNELGQTLLHKAALRNSSPLTFSYILNVVCVDPLHGDLLGMTPLHYAASSGNVFAMQMLLERTGGFEYYDASGRNPLHYACIEGHSDVVHLLLNYVRDASVVGQRDRAGNTALGLALRVFSGDIRRTQEGRRRVETVIKIMFDYIRRNRSLQYEPQEEMDEALFVIMPETPQSSWFLRMFSGYKSLEFKFFVAQLLIYFVWTLIGLYIVPGRISRLCAESHPTLCFHSNIAFMVLWHVWAAHSMNHVVDIGQRLRIKPALPALFLLYGVSTNIAVHFIGNESAWSWPVVILAAAVVILLGVVALGDPGRIHPRYDSISDIAMGRSPMGFVMKDNGKIRHKSDEDIEHTLRYCPTCQMVTPLRSKHSFYEDVEIARYDHYCTYLYTSIGYRNHSYFVMVLLCMIALFVTISYSHYDDARYEQGKIQAFFLDHPILFVHWTESLAMVMWIAMLLFQQVRQALANITTNEKINWRRYSLFKLYSSAQAGRSGSKADRSHYHRRGSGSGGRKTHVLKGSPYSMGALGNIKDFVARSYDWREAYSYTAFRRRSPADD